MARKNYPFDSRRDKKMTNLVSGLLAGLIVAPFALLEAAAETLPDNDNRISENQENKGKDTVEDAKEKKEEAVIWFWLGLIFLTPISLSVAFISLPYPIINSLVFTGSIGILIYGWCNIISKIRKAYKVAKKQRCIWKDF